MMRQALDELTSARPGPVHIATMSAFAVIFNRDRAPADQSLVSRMLDRMEHRGPDGRHVVGLGEVAMGHLHFWTTPEEVGEVQPISAAGGSILLCSTAAWTIGQNSLRR